MSDALAPPRRWRLQKCAFPTTTTDGRELDLQETVEVIEVAALLTDNEREAVLAMMRYAWAHGVPHSLNHRLANSAFLKIARGDV
jgi:hypothetical protein